MKKEKKTLLVTGLNGVQNIIIDCTINRIVVSKKWSYDEEKDQLVFEYAGNRASIGSQGVFIERAHNKNTKSNYAVKRRGRTLHISAENTKINLSRLYMLCREISLGRLAIHQIDDFVLNHKDNMGLDEGLLEDNSPLWVNDYELVTKKDNTCHGVVWNKLFGWGIKTKFSAMDYDFITIVIISDSLEELKKHLEIKGIDFENYILK